MFCVDTTIHRPVGIDVLHRHDRPSNPYWTMDGRVYAKHQCLLDDGWPCLHKTSIPTGRWMAMSTQNINTYWMMDGHVYTKHQCLLDDTTVHRPVGIDVLRRHDRPSSSRY
jgi:hypothetical protein